MVYSANFHKLVMIGSLYTDTFNVTLSIVPSGAGAMPAVTQTLCDSVAVQIAAWWPGINQGLAASGIGITAEALLKSIKLNRIGPDGRYTENDTVEKVLTTPVAGGWATTKPPPQLTLVSTLRGVNDRARAGKGRMYWPPTATSQFVQSDGRVAVLDATNYAIGTRNLLTKINDVYLAAGIPAVAGIASKQGTGAFQGVKEVTVGRVIDTMRSRRNKLLEAPQVAGL